MQISGADEPEHGEPPAGRQEAVPARPRPPARLTSPPAAELKDHIAALNAVRGYLSPDGRVQPKNTYVDGVRLGDMAEQYKIRHQDDVKGTPFEYIKGSGKVAGHLPDTTWSGNRQPYCWHQQNGRVNSLVGSYSEKYPVGYMPTVFLYAGVKDNPGTYTTEMESGAVTVGAFDLCHITRTP